MSNETRIELDEEMKMDEERLMKKINADPNLQDISMPADARDIIWKEIQICEAKEAEAEELIRLGKIYKRKRKNKKYLVLAAVMVFVLAFGMTSIGGAEKIFEKFKILTTGREQVQINSTEDVYVIDSISEEKAYEEIEEKYGFTPVKLEYRPEGVEFQEAIMGDDIQGIQLIYNKRNEAGIIYLIRPSYRLESLATDIEDTKVKEYPLVVEGVLIDVKQYCIEESKNERWTGEFSHQDVEYFLMATDIVQEEFEKILNNLYFF